MNREKFYDQVARERGEEAEVAAAGVCACFPNTCRGGEVIDGKLSSGLRCVAATQPPTDIGIGDVRSDEKGSGARYNAGKPPLHLVPLSMLAGHLHRMYPAQAAAVQALDHLGGFQQTGDAEHLFCTLTSLGHEGWEECASVFDYGKRKYAEWNWAKGMPWSVPLACAARHLLAMIRDEGPDVESGRPHRGHVFCNVVMLLQYTKTFTEGNDLPKKGTL